MNLPRVRERPPFCNDIVPHPAFPTTPMWYISRPGTPLSEYLHKDGTWHMYCGVENMYETEEEALTAMREAEKQVPQEIFLDIEL